MTTFTIDTDNNITAFAGPDQAEAVIAAGAQPFVSSVELTQLAAGWPAERLLSFGTRVMDVLSRIPRTGD